MLTLAHVLQEVVRATPTGFAGLLVAINAQPNRKNTMSYQTLTNKLNPNCENMIPNIKELEFTLNTLGGHVEVARYFAQLGNAVVVPLPDVAEGDMGLLDDFMNISVQLGEASQAFQKSYADGDINKIEFKKISKEVDDVVSALLAFKGSVERVVR